MTALPASNFEHFGINVVDLDKMIEYYCAMFGFQISDRGTRFNGSRIAFLTKSAKDHHQMVLIEGRPAGDPGHQVNQISFAFASLDDLRTAYETLVAQGQTEIMQIDHGNAWSLYTKDLEGNPLELFVDSVWHTPQPCRGDLDITRPSEEILATTEALCRSRPGFMTRSEWTASMQARFAEATPAPTPAPALLNS